MSNGGGRNGAGGRSGGAGLPDRAGLADRTAGEVRVLVFAEAGAEDVPAVEAAYHRISEHLVGTSGLLGNELLRSPMNSSAFVVMSHWASLADFQAWEGSPEHKPATAPLRPFVTGAAVFEVTACY